MFKRIDETESITDKIVEVIKANNLEAAEMRRKIYSLKKLAEDVAEEKEEPATYIAPKKETNYDDYLELLIESEMLEEQLSSLEDNEDLESSVFKVLKESNYSGQAIIRVIANYHKKIVDTSKTLKELIGEMSVDEILSTRAEITIYKNMKKYLLNAYRANNRSKFILVPSEDGSIKLFLSMKRLTPEQNSILLSLLDKISLVTPSNNGVYYSGNKDFGIVYDRLDEKHIALIDLVYDGKKDNKIISYYKKNKNNLKNLLEDQKFLSEQENYIARLNISLEQTNPKQYKKVN